MRAIAKSASEFEEAVKHSVEINFAGPKSHTRAGQRVRVRVRAASGGIERMLKESKSLSP